MNWLRIAAIFANASLVGAAPIYTLADLGTLGGSSAMATALNASGATVGEMTSPSGFMNAFSFSAAGVTYLSAGQASGINNAGQIAGTQQIGSQTYATIWNNGVATKVAGAGSYAMAINNAGNVAGMVVNNGQGNAFVSQNGTIIDLGTFAGGYWSAAYDLNNEGQAVGYGMTATGAFRAFIWTPGQGFSQPGTLGGANSYAFAINDSGIAVGSAQLSNGLMHAFVSNGASMQDLGTLGGSASYAYGINDLSNVVGYSWTATGQTDGFLEEGGVMYDINALLINDPGWTVTELYAINDSNQVVGVGVLNGVEHAVLLTDPPTHSTRSNFTSSAPEPSAWLLTSAGLLLCFLLRFQRARRAGL